MPPTRHTPCGASSTPPAHESYASVDPRPRPGFRQDAVIAYVTTGSTLQRRTGNAPQGTELCPLTLLTKGSGAGALQYATTDLPDRTRRLATGWSLDDRAVGVGADGIAGYLWSKRVPGTVAAVRSYDPGPPTFRIDTVQAHEAVAPSSGRTVLGYGFAVRQPGTAALAAFTNDAGAWRYATTAAARGRPPPTASGPPPRPCSCSPTPTRACPTSRCTAPRWPRRTGRSSPSTAAPGWAGCTPPSPSPSCPRTSAHRGPAPATRSTT